MKLLIQRVKEASVSINSEVVGSIEKGLLVFVGVCEQDSKDIAEKMIKKLIGLRIFEDENGKTNLDIKSINGQLLLVSQFTLYADCRKGNRPSFTNAGNPVLANELYRYIIDKCKDEIPIVQEGCFGADMKVSLVNDGPFTVMLDSNELFL